MKMGDDVLFIINHKLKKGVILRQDSTTAIIKADKIYHVRKSQIAKEDLGGKHARERFSIRSNNASNSRCDGKKDNGLWPTGGGKGESSQVLKGNWAI